MRCKYMCITLRGGQLMKDHKNKHNAGLQVPVCGPHLEGDGI